MSRFPACNTCGKLNPASGVVEREKFTCKNPRGVAPPCTPCLNLGELQDQIAETQMFLDHLNSHCQRLQSDVNHVHDPFISKIPLEVASRIFIFCLKEDESSLYSCGRANHRVPLVLAAVSQRWRHIALATSVLWTFFFLDLDKVSNSEEYKETLKVLLDRSGPYPLSVWLHLAYSDDDDGSRASLCRGVIDILNMHSHRWRTLDIRVPSNLVSKLEGNGSNTSVLERLEIVPRPYNNRTNAVFRLQNSLPSPQRVTIFRMRFKFIWINWSNVTHVVVNTLDVDECLLLFREAPQIRSCTLENVDSKDDEFDVAYPEHGIIHSYVTSLVIQFSASLEPAALLAHVAFPSLKKLVVRSAGETLVAMADCMKRSSPPLTHLEIEDLAGYDHDVGLSRLLWEVPTVEYLSISYIRLTNAFFRLFRSPVSANPEERRFLPSLTHLNVDGPLGQPPFSWKKMAKAFLTRFNRADGVQWPLRTFDIIVGPEPGQPGYYLCESAISAFEELMGHGVDIQITNDYRDREEDVLSYSKAHHQRMATEGKAE